MTDLIAEIRAALLLANPNDLEPFRKYLQWMKVRRMVNNRFYFPAHWVRSAQKYHWLGS